jgi:PBP1b-binding outer membrane lipoprotein LpoB
LNNTLNQKEKIMNRLTWSVLLALAALLLIGCSEEKTTPPAEKPAATKQEASPVTEEIKQKVEVVQQKAEEAATAIKQEVQTQAEAVEQQAATVVEQGKVGLAEMVAKVSQEPKTVSYPASKGLVTFNHAVHAEQYACNSCHETDPPQKLAIDRATAHALCKGCHKESGGDAPTSCSGCHKG